jgi:hypothetical protein
MRNRALVFFALLLLAVPTIARIGTIDVVPAATVLYPWFEVDPANPNGVNTLLTLQNASATAILAHVTLWTDYGIPTATFNIYLTGYDVETIDMYAVLQRVPPRTASAGQDPTDTISPHGPMSQDINFASCTGLLPDVQDSVLAPQIIAAHRGQEASDYFGGAGFCGGHNYGDGRARGFVTIDTVNNCTPRKPGAVGYFINGGGGDATNQNVMLGDYVILDRPNDRVLADNAVHLEAAPGVGGTVSYPPDPVTAVGAYTFYSRFAASGGHDNREPLPTAWAGRYSVSRTTIGYWRDPGVKPVPFACGGAPPFAPIDQRQIRAFGADGNVVAVNAGARFPRVSGVTPASGASGLGLTSALGWTFLNLNLPTNVVQQSWVSFQHVPPAAAVNAPTAYSVPGIQLGNAASGDNPTLP